MWGSILFVLYYFFEVVVHGIRAGSEQPIDVH